MRCYPRKLIQKRVVCACFKRLKLREQNLGPLSLELDADFTKFISRALAFEANNFDLTQGTGEHSWTYLLPSH